jgi:hypothetical protein
MARKTIDDKQAELLKAIRSCGSGWHSRGEIAAQLGKNRLGASDAMILELLAKQGFIIAEQHEIDAPISIRWEYQLADVKTQKAR